MSAYVYQHGGCPACWDLVIRYRPTAKVFSTEVLDLFTFRDGKIIELIEYADTALVKAIIS